MRSDWDQNDRETDRGVICEGSGTGTRVLVQMLSVEWVQEAEMQKASQGHPTTDPKRAPVECRATFLHKITYSQ